MLLLLALACNHKTSDDSAPVDTDSGAADSVDTDSVDTDSGDTADTDTGTTAAPIVAGTWSVSEGSYGDDGTASGTWLSLLSQPLILTAADDGWAAGWPLFPDALTGTVDGSTGGLTGSLVLTANDCSWTLALDLALTGTADGLVDAGTGLATSNGVDSCGALSRLVSDNAGSAGGSLEIDEERVPDRDGTRSYVGPPSGDATLPVVADGGVAFADAPDAIWVSTSSSGEGDGGFAGRLLNVATADWALVTEDDGARGLYWLGAVASVDATPDGDVFTASGSTDVLIDACTVHIEAELEMALTGADVADYAILLTSSDDGAPDCVELAWAWGDAESLAGQAVLTGTREAR